MTKLEILTKSLVALCCCALIDTRNVFAVKALCTPPSGLIARWSGENNPNDSIASNNGVFVGPNLYEVGVKGMSFSLDGSSNYIKVAHSNALNFTGSMSIEAWIKPSQNRFANIISKWGDADSWQNQRSYGLIQTSNFGLAFAISDNTHQLDSSFHSFYTPENVIFANSWNHLLATYSNDTGTRRIYVNGLKVAERRDTAINLFASNADVGIGAFVRSPTVVNIDNRFSGQIDEVGLYNHSLSDEEAFSAYKSFSSECQPLNTPTPTVGTKRVVLVPGMMASWNADAILKCETNGDEWTMASYAEDVYQPLIDALKNAGQEVRPYFYDWRRPIAENAAGLNTIITEPVNLVGHSMGGLVGRSYLESSQGRNLSKLYTIGTPHLGSTLAYPMWSAGEIWQGGLVQKIGMSLALKRCEGWPRNDRGIVRNNFPSIQDVLPIYEYLYDAKSANPVLIRDSVNSWLRPWDNNQYGVKIGSLAGIGVKTLKSIYVHDSNRIDEWVDGKPSKKVYVAEGDGSVLVSSAKFGTSEDIIPGTHEEIVTDGIPNVLRFLGLPDGPIITAITDPKSAIVIAVSGARAYMNNNFDSNGMISIMNPVPGTRKMKIVPITGESIVMVGKFWENESWIWEDYSFSGLKTRDFDVEF